MSSKFRIGSIARCIGMRGEIIINPDTFDPDRFNFLKSVFIGRSEAVVKEFPVDAVRFQKERPVMKLSTVDSRTDAEQLIGQILFVDQEDRIELPDGLLFIHDIIGMDVYTVENEYVGKVKDVLQLPAQNVYVVGGDNNEYMIPAVDQFIETIDETEKRIRIKPIEGLLE